MTHSPGQSTRMVHNDSVKDGHGAPHGLTYNTTTFAFEKALLDVVEGRRGWALYTRNGMNPTTFSLGERSERP